MNIFKKLSLIITLILLGTSGMLFGCGELYSDLKIELDTEDIILYLNPVETEVPAGDEGEEGIPVANDDGSKATVIASIKNLPEGVSNHITYYQTTDNVVHIEELYTDNLKNQVIIEITAIRAGITELVITTEEGNKSAILKVTVIERVEDIDLKEEYAQVFEVDVPTAIDVTGALNFYPATTNEKGLRFALDENSPQGIEVTQDGIVTATIDFTDIVFVRAISTFDESISQLIPIKVIAKIDVETLRYMADGYGSTNNYFLLFSAYD